MLLNHISHPEFVVQGHRYDIFEDIGCFPALVNSLPTYFLSGIWPIPIGLISAVYCGTYPFLIHHTPTKTHHLHSSLPPRIYPPPLPTQRLP